MNSLEFRKHKNFVTHADLVVVHEEMTSDDIIFADCHMKKRITIVTHSDVVFDQFLRELSKRNKFRFEFRSQQDFITQILLTSIPS
jgi:hypothetical protein